MSKTYKIAAYVKLAKLWERSKDEAIALQQEMYSQKEWNIPDAELVELYIDITGQKEICKRPAMLKLINDVQFGDINCLFVQTKGYMAANTREFCFLLRFLWELNPDFHLLTEDSDYNINTIKNDDNQKEALLQMADTFIGLAPSAYHEWKLRVYEGIHKFIYEEGED